MLGGHILINLMKNIFRNYRYYVLFALCIICVLGVFSEPAEALSAGKWFLALVISKAVGFLAGYLLYRLYIHWDKLGAIPEISDTEIN